jgi:poly(A) polymerase
MALSRERIAAELLKLLVAPGAVSVVTLMEAQGIFRPVLPEVDAAGVARLAVLAQRESAAGVSPDAIRRLAALVAPDAAEGVGARLKLSNNDRKRLIQASAGPGDEGGRALGYRVGVESAVDRLLLAGIDPSDLIDWSRPSLPIGGGALVARGLAKGPDVARALRAVENRWIAELFPDADRVAAIADDEVAQVLRSRRNA